MLYTTHIFAIDITISDEVQMRLDKIYGAILCPSSRMTSGFLGRELFPG